MIVKTQGLREQSVGVIDESVDAAELLERLDGTCDEESSLRLDGVVAEEIAPRTRAQRGFVFACSEDVGVESDDGLLRHVVCVQTGENVKGFRGL